MGALLDPDQRVALKFTGNGPLRKIIVEAEGDGTVRGYVEVPRVDLPPRNGKLDVGGAIGREGYLTVTKDLRLKEPYNGIVKLYTGEIASDIAFYLTESEQIPSAVGLGVYVEADGNVSASGGFSSNPPARGRGPHRHPCRTHPGLAPGHPAAHRRHDPRGYPCRYLRGDSIPDHRNKTAFLQVLVLGVQDRAGPHHAGQVTARGGRTGPGGVRHLLPLLQQELCLPEGTSPEAHQGDAMNVPPRTPQSP